MGSMYDNETTVHKMATASSIQETQPMADSSPNFEKDEFIIDKKKLKLIAEVQEKLFDSFRVTMAFNDSFSDDITGDKQWVEVEGLPENRKLAKEYIQTLCNPIEVHVMKYPQELESIIRDPNIYTKIEKQSRTVIQQEQPGELLIYGNDDLSVTLASSALEDVISQHVDQVNFQPFPNEQQNEASRRLNEELKRRLSTENGHTEEEEDLMSVNNAIKRTILDVLQSRSSDLSKDSFEGYGIKAREGVSDSGYISIHSDTSESSKASLGEAAKQLGLIQLSSGATAQQNNNNNSGPEVSTIAVTESSSQDKGKHLREWALSKGYTQDQVQGIFDKHGYDMHFQTFYRALNNITSSEEEPAPSVPVSGSTDETTDTAPKTDPIQPSKQVASYISKLSKDYVEEDDASREELIKRNAERQRLLMDIFERRKGNKDGLTEPEVLEISDDEEEEKPQTSAKEDTVDSRFQQNNQGFRQPYNRSQHNRQQHQHQHQSYQHRSRSPINHNNAPYNTTGRNYLQGRSPSPKRYRGQNHNAGYSGAHSTDQRMNSGSLRPAIAVKTSKRYIVIDGSNVAFTHGNGRIFSCRGIELAIDYFRKKGHTEITAFVPQWRTRTLNDDYPISDQHLLTQLKEQGYLVFTPSRRVPGRNIVCYDDRYVIRLAEETEGVIVSNDNYRDLWREKIDWRHIIENRLLMYSFVGDIFMPPDDPLGKDGPSLEQFLEKGNFSATSGDSRPGHMGLQGRPLQYQQPHHHQSYPQHQQQQHSYRPPPLIANPPQQNAWNSNRLQLGHNQQQGNTRQQHHRQQHHNQHQQQQRNNAHSSHGQAQAYNHRYESSRQNRNQRGEDTVDGSWQHVGNRRPDKTKKGPPRDPQVTEQLKEQLSAVFSENQEGIETVLRDNPSETDLNTLSSHLLGYIEHN